MPSTINGIGTWYYGQKRIHSLQGTCESCNSFESLKSYDTTKYFVVFFVPLIPLGDWRVLKECPRCKRHRAMPLKAWEQAKRESVAEIMQQIESDVGDAEGVKNAIRVAIGYQDLPLLDQVAEHLARPMTDDFDVQSLLGMAYSYFARSSEAEAAFRAALAIRPDPETSRMLSVEILRQGRPRDAEPLVRHILEQKDFEHVGNLFLLIEGYQAQADHLQATEWVRRLEQTFPQLATDREFQAIQKSAAKYAKSGRAVPLKTLADPKKIGYKEAGGGAKLAKLVGPVLASVALIAYLYSAFYIGKHRNVYLVSGLQKPYAIQLNGQRYDLAPLSQQKIQVVEGDLQIAPVDGNSPLAPSAVRVATSFWLRPFTSPTFVLNPDQVAVVSWQKVAYGSNVANLPAAQHQLYTNSVLHEFSGVDYEFKPFPDSLQVKGQEIRYKTGIKLLEAKHYNPQSLVMILQQGLEPQRLTDYVQQRLRLEPENEYLVAFLSSTMKPGTFVEAAGTRLTVRPLLMIWHLTYQDAMERHDPKYDLQAEYQKLLSADPNNPDLQYLLSCVIDDPDEQEKLRTQAASADPPSAYGLYGLAGLKLTTGDFPAALKYGEAANQIQVNNLFRHILREIWLANHKFDKLAEANRQDQTLSSSHFLRTMADVKLMLQRGDEPGATALVNAYPAGQLLSAELKSDQNYLKSLVAYGTGNTPEYERLMNEILAGQKSFAVSFTAGRLEEAAGTLTTVERANDRWPSRLLLYMAHHAAGNLSIAEQQLQLAITDLQQGDADQRKLAEALLPDAMSDPHRFVRLPFGTDQKRTVLATLGTRFPNDRATYFDLAQRLNYELTMPYWFLKKYLE